MLLAPTRHGPLTDLTNIWPGKPESRARRSERDPTTLANQPEKNARLLLYMTQERRLAAGPESGPKTRASP